MIQHQKEKNAYVNAADTEIDLAWHLVHFKLEFRHPRLFDDSLVSPYLFVKRSVFLPWRRLETVPAHRSVSQAHDLSIATVAVHEAAFDTSAKIETEILMADPKVAMIGRISWEFIHKARRDGLAKAARFGNGTAAKKLDVALALMDDGAFDGVAMF